MMVVDDKEIIIKGASEVYNPFERRGAKSFVSTYLPELSSTNPFDVHVRRSSILAVHELGHFWDLNEHEREVMYTDNKKLCAMTKVDENKTDLASRIRQIELRDIGFCGECLSYLR